MIRFTLAEGSHTIPCPRCAALTDVHVYQEGGSWKIKTSAAKAKAGR